MTPPFPPLPWYAALYGAPPTPQMPSNSFGVGAPADPSLPTLSATPARTLASQRADSVLQAGLDNDPVLGPLAGHLRAAFTNPNAKTKQQLFADIAGLVPMVAGGPEAAVATSLEGAPLSAQDASIIKQIESEPLDVSHYSDSDLHDEWYKTLSGLTRGIEAYENPIAQAHGREYLKALDAEIAQRGSVARPGVAPISAQEQAADIAAKTAAAGHEVARDELARATGRAPKLLPPGTGQFMGEVPPEQAAKNLAAFKEGTVMPDVMYHGTPASFDTFERTHDVGFHVGTADQANKRLDAHAIVSSPSKPMTLSEINDVLSGAAPPPPTPPLRPGSNLMPLHVSLKNPIHLPQDYGVFIPSEPEFTAELQRQGILTPEEIHRAWAGTPDKAPAEVLRDILKGKGYDGMIYPNQYEGHGEPSAIVFDRTQLKSATGNQGTFDPTDPRIIAGLAGAAAGGSSVLQRLRALGLVKAKQPAN